MIENAYLSDMIAVIEFLWITTRLSTNFIIREHELQCFAQAML